MSQAITYFALMTAILNCSSAITDEQKLRVQKELIDIGTYCITQHPITAEDIKSFKNKEFPDSANAGCFIACVFKKIGIFDDKGDFSQKAIIERASNIFDDKSELKNLEHVINACTKINEESVTDGDKGCDRAKLAFKCLIENSEQFGFNFEF